MSKKVLIVDDESALRNILAMVFQGFGDITVYQAPDGETGVREAVKIVPDLIVMDYKLPGISGWECTRQIKAHTECKDSIIIGYTAWASLDNIKDGISSGLSEILTKPIDMDDWKKLFDKYLLQK